MSEIPNTVKALIDQLDQLRSHHDVLTWHHPRFGEFVTWWEAARALNPDEGNYHDLRLAASVMEQMGGPTIICDVQRSVDWLRAQSWESGRDVQEVFDRWREGPDAIRKYEGLDA